MATKPIIILEKQQGGRVRYVIRADVPVARQRFYANAQAVSAFKSADPVEQSTLDSEVQTGTVVEKVDIVAIDGSQAQVAAVLEAERTRFQNEVNNVNPWSRYGTFFDGAVWTTVNVA